MRKQLISFAQVIKFFLNNKAQGWDSIWIRADDAYIVGEIYTL